jgi:hypothetical protein
MPNDPPDREEEGMGTAPDPPPLPPWLRVVLTAFIALCVAGAGVGLVTSVDDDGHGHKVTKRTVTFKVDSADKDHAPDKTITLNSEGQSVLEEQQTDVEQDRQSAAEASLHEEHLPPADVAAKAHQLQPPGQPEVPARVPLASVTQPGCTTAIVRNQSSRRGSPVLFGFIHWTGSIPTLGPQGGLAIVRWFDLGASQASSHYITDQQGRCWLTVPESAKAWTEANANSWGVSVEITNAGVQPLFQTAKGRAIVVKLMIGWHHRWKIPYRHGIIHQGKRNSCVPVRSGFLAHRDAGRCGGGHPDVGTFDMDGLIREAQAKDHLGGLKPLTKTQKHACDVLNFHRHRAHAVGRWYPSRAKAAARWKQQIPAGRCLSRYRKK